MRMKFVAPAIAIRVSPTPPFGVRREGEKSWFSRETRRPDSSWACASLWAADQRRRKLPIVEPSSVSVCPGNTLLSDAIRIFGAFGSPLGAGVEALGAGAGSDSFAAPPTSQSP